MVFHSLEFVLLFLPVVVIVHGLAVARAGARGSTAVLLAASLAFYALTSAQTLPLLAGSLIANYLFAQRIALSEAPATRRRWLIVGVSANVVLLAVFKYTHFFLENLALIASWQLHVPDFVLPLGLSFFTIQQVMYLVDCYEQLTPRAPFVQHALFISLFPYIAAGPIARAGDVLPQLGERDRLPATRIAAGLVLFILGLIKKIVVAESFGKFASIGFSAASTLGGVEAWITSLAYTFQIYFDFSGYSDMAIACGLFVGLVLPQNFDSPLKATSLIDFWKRWHITLSSFITTYLYTPMARAARPLTFPKAMAITIISMTIAGLWHGAAWGYVLFGVLHGTGLVVNHVWRRRKRKLPAAAAWALTFLFLATTLVIFRAHDLHDANSILSAMSGARGFRSTGAFSGGTIEKAQAAVVSFLGVLVALGAPNSTQIVAEFRPSRVWVVTCALALFVCLLFMNASGAKDFIYRDF